MSGIFSVIGKAAAVMVAMGALGHAAPAEGWAQEGAKAARMLPRQDGGRGTITVEFAGGTVAEYIAALKEANKPLPLNVVLSEGAATERLTAISLRQVSLAAAVQAIPAASSSGVNSWQIMRLMDALPGEDAVNDSKDTAPVYQVYRMPGQQRPRGGVILEVFSVQKIVGRAASPEEAEKRIAAVLMAAETALRMDEHRATAPEMKFHKESGLLIVRGEQADVMAVKDVIERMSDDSGRQADLAAQLLSVQQQMEINVRKAELNVKAMQDQADVARKKLAQIEQMVAQGTVSSTEALEMKAEVDRRATAVEMARLEVEAAKVAAKSGGSVPWLSEIPLIRGPIGNQRGGGAAVESADVAAELARLRDENAALRDQLAAVSKHLKDLEAAMAASKANNQK